MEDCIGTSELALSEKFEQEAPVVIAVNNCVPNFFFFLSHLVIPNSNIEAARTRTVSYAGVLFKCSHRSELKPSFTGVSVSQLLVRATAHNRHARFQILFLFLI